jgi:hypothetical protein
MGRSMKWGPSLVLIPLSVPAGPEREWIIIDLEDNVLRISGSSWLNDAPGAKSSQPTGSLTGKHRGDEAELTNCGGPPRKC